MHKKRFHFEYLNTFGKFHHFPNILNAELDMYFIRMVLLLLLWRQRIWIFYSITDVKHAESCFLTGVISWHSWALSFSANRSRVCWGMFSAADKSALSAVMSDHSGRMWKWPVAVPNLEENTGVRGWLKRVFGDVLMRAREKHRILPEQTFAFVH